MTNLRAALDTYPANFDNDANFDTLNLAEIGKGRLRPTRSTQPTTLRHFGAIVTATYKPLIFASGLSPEQDDPFDYVDPQYKPFTKSETLGRNLTALSRRAAGPDLSAWVEWRTRPSCPRLAQLHHQAVDGAVLSAEHHRGIDEQDQLRAVHPGQHGESRQRHRPNRATGFDGETDARRAALWDLTLNFSVRLTCDTYYDLPTNTVKFGYVSRNHYLCYPTHIDQLAGIDTKLPSLITPPKY